MQMAFQLVHGPTVLINKLITCRPGLRNTDDSSPDT